MYVTYVSLMFTTKTRLFSAKDPLPLPAVLRAQDGLGQLHLEGRADQGTFGFQGPEEGTVIGYGMLVSMANYIL